MTLKCNSGNPSRVIKEWYKITAHFKDKEKILIDKVDFIPMPTIITSTKTIDRRWKERWFTRPWKPFEKTKEVQQIDGYMYFKKGEKKIIKDYSEIELAACAISVCEVPGCTDLDCVKYRKNRKI